MYSADYPDLRKHNNCMAAALTPTIYARLRDKTTPKDWTLDQCIQTGVDNPGHPFIKTVGIVAGDEESYEVAVKFYIQLFCLQLSKRGKLEYLISPIRCLLRSLTLSSRIDTMVMTLAQWSTPPTWMLPRLHLHLCSISRLILSCLSACQLTILFPPQITSGMFDERYVLSSRVRTGRSIRGLSLPPACSRSERRDVERVVVTALSGLKGDLAGRYYSLGEMSDREQQQLIDVSA